MNISFTLSHLEAFAVNISRFDEIYPLLRRYNGVALGVSFSSQDAQESFHEMPRYSDNGYEFVSLGGNDFSYTATMRAFHVFHTHRNLQDALSVMKNFGGSGAIKEAKAILEHLKELLTNAEL